MLTRDIALEDALLDLLDNCLDGIVRAGINKNDTDRPYAGYSAKLILNPLYFLIEDNCGGIPIKTAKNYAFRLGRAPQEPTAEDSATIGMYGIGMKRAIFKLGREAVVESRHDQAFQVVFTEDWMGSEDWEPLTMYDVPDAAAAPSGTRIEVHTLNPDVAASFSEAQWIEDFRRTLARHYSIIIAKGFEVLVGTRDGPEGDLRAVIPEDFALLRSPGEGDAARITPYIYSGTIRNVEVEVYAGLYRTLPTADEAEREEDTSGSSDDAGWTVACNDRVVIWKDKSRLTGWGEANVPVFHGQFIAITGLVLLRSSDPSKLPLTTTKRGIDASSELYSEVKDLMQEATKFLTSFTNKWKRFPDEREAIYKGSDYVGLKDLRNLTTTLNLTPTRRFENIRKYAPTYPEPETTKETQRVSFLARRTDVQTLARYLFDDENQKAGIVGEAAFRFALERSGVTKS